MRDSQTYYHGTKADLATGDFIEPGRMSNYGSRRHAGFVYLSATLDAAIWGAELAVGPGRGRIYVVEPTGPIEDDPNLTNKRFPGNPTRSYRSRDPFRVIPSLIAGSAVAGAICMAMGVQLKVPHGGIFVLPIPNAVGNLPGFVIAMLAGTAVSVIALRIVKPRLAAAATSAQLKAA